MNDEITLLSTYKNATVIHTIGSLGLPGKSAYRLALDEGFEGSMEEWLLSLAVSNLPEYTSEDSNKILRLDENGVPYWSQLVKSDVGLGDVDNTSDEDKPLSKAMRNALSQKLGLDNIEEFLTDPEINLVLDLGEL